jgi:uncharacterized protein YfaS (alpha-2-macroglobulin family)
MDLSPGEKAVLGQIRVLYSIAAGRDQQIKALTAQWPPTHHAAFQKAYEGLLAKRLIQDAGAQVFWITDAGLKAMELAMAKPPAQVRAVAEPRPVQTKQRPAQQAYSPDASRRRGSALSRFVSGLLRPRT